MKKEPIFIVEDSRIILYGLRQCGAGTRLEPRLREIFGEVPFRAKDLYLSWEEGKHILWILKQLCQEGSHPSFVNKVLNLQSRIIDAIDQSLEG